MLRMSLALAMGILTSASPVFAQSLIGATFKGDLSQVRTLLDQGADVNGRDNQGVTPLHYAAQQGHNEIVELLISRGADVNLGTLKGGHAPIHLACSQGQLEAVQLLTKHGADVTKVNQNGDTPLHVAAVDNQPAIATFLLDQKASINAINRAGLTPMKVALARNYPEFLEVLRIRGAVLENESEIIRYAENQLWLRAYGVTAMDGNVDPDTQAAVKAYQQDAGLKPDGLVTLALADHLTSSGQHKLSISGNTKIVTNVFITYSRLVNAHKWNGVGRPISVTGRAATFTPGSNLIVTCGVPPRFPSEAVCWSAKDHQFGNLKINGSIIVLRNGLVLMRGSEVSVALQ